MACQVARLPGAPAHICLEHTQVAEPVVCFVLELWDTVLGQTSYCWPENVHLKQVHGREPHVLSSGLSKVREPGNHIIGKKLAYCPKLGMF